jgi:hypothetical protein
MLLQALASVLLLVSFLQEGSAPASQQFRISGIVVDALNGQPLAHAQLFLASPKLPDSPQIATAGDDGGFAFENLAPAKYTLSARRKGYIQQFYKQHESFSTAIIVGPDLHTENLRFELRPTASVSGQILDEMNDPVRNAQVMLIHSGLRSGRLTTWRQGQVMTDDQGHYHFGHLAPGTYFVCVTAQPWYAQRVARQRVARQRVAHFDPSSGQTAYQEITYGDSAFDVVYPATFFPNATDISGAAPITLHPGDAQVADIALRPIPALHVTIRSSSPNESEQSWPQVTQHLADGIEQGIPTQTQQLAPGLIEITGLPPGRFNLALVSQKGNESTRSQTVQLASDSEISAPETLSSSSLSGVVKMDDGSALSRPVLLRLQSAATGAGLDAQSELTGEFALKGQNIAPGTYDVTVPGPRAYVVRSLSATGAKVSGRSVETGSAQDVRLTVVVSEGSGQVTGVALKDGEAIDGVMIVLVPQDPEHNLALFRRDQSDSDGSFNLFGILPGKYTVVAIEKGWDLEWSRPGVLQRYLAGGETLQITANSKIAVKVNVVAGL